MAVSKPIRRLAASVLAIAGVAAMGPLSPCAGQAGQLSDAPVSTAGRRRGSGARRRRNGRLERATGRLRRSAHDRRRHPRRGGRFRQLPCQPVARCRAPRRQPRKFPALHRRADARSAYYGSARCAAGIHQVDLGLSRPPGQRRAHRARPRAVDAIRLDLRRGRARLRRRPLHHRRDLGRRIELRHLGRRPLGAALDRDLGLRRPPPRLFPRGVFVGARHPAARRYRARPPGRLLGRRFRADAIHADDVQALRRRFRRRRPPRRHRLGAGRDRVHGQQSEKRRLGQRPDLGLRGHAAAEFRLSLGRPVEADDGARMANSRRAARRQTSRFRMATTAPSCSFPPALAGRRS